MSDSLEARVAALEAKVLELQAALGKPRRQRKEKPKTNTSQIREAFLHEFHKSHSHEYCGWGARENAMAANWLTSIPLQKALDYVIAYFRWPNEHVVKAGHPFWMLVKKTPELDAAMRRSASIMRTIAEIRAVEKIFIAQIQDEVEVKVHGEIEAGRGLGPTLSHERGKALQVQAGEHVPGGGDDLSRRALPLDPSRGQGHEAG